jgi:hypothetical protein
VADSLALVQGQHLRLLLGAVDPAPEMISGLKGAAFWPLLHPDAEGNGAASLEIGPRPSTDAPPRSTMARRQSFSE